MGIIFQMNTKKATKLDMDDRAKIIQYFSKANNYGLGNGESALESVRIEDMFGTCWSVPRAPPALPTVITVQVQIQWQAEFRRIQNWEETPSEFDVNALKHCRRQRALARAPC